MTTETSVWIQLYLDTGKSGDVFKIQPAPKDVNDLKKAVKEECPNTLQRVDSVHLTVFAAGVDPNNDEPLRPDFAVPDGTTYESPLIVVAAPPPQQQQQQQDGEYRVVVFSDLVVCVQFVGQNGNTFKSISPVLNRSSAFCFRSRMAN